MTPGPVPDRTTAQRLDALTYANAVRTFRSALKADVEAARLDADAVLVSNDPRVATMKLMDLMLAVPGMGKVKANKILARSRVSPSKTIGGLSPRQRGELLVPLRTHRSGSNLWADRARQAGRRA